MVGSWLLVTILKVNRVNIRTNILLRRLDTSSGLIEKIFSESIVTARTIKKLLAMKKPDFLVITTPQESDSFSHTNSFASVSYSELLTYEALDSTNV